MEQKAVTISTEYIRLDALLKLGGLVMTGGEAKQVIQSGQVTVDGAVCTMRGKKIRPGQTVQFQETNVSVTEELT